MILVTGGTGLVGAHLLYNLTSKGHKVRAIHRAESNLEAVKKVFSYYSNQPDSLFDSIEWFKADLNNIPLLTEAFKGVTGVYHCAALISFDPKDKEILYKTNVEGTANIVNFCINSTVKKLCYVSSIAAIGPSIKKKEVTEETEWNNPYTNVYAKSKHMAEMEVWRGSQEGLAVAIINPGVIIGPGFWGSGSGKFITTAAKKPYFYPLGGSGFVGVTDVVNALELLLESPIQGERFIMVSENKTFKSILSQFAAELEIRPPKKPIPFFVLKVFWRIDWFFSMLFRYPRKLTKSRVMGLETTEIYNSNKIEKQTEFRFTPLYKQLVFSCSKFKDEMC